MTIASTGSKTGRVSSKDSVPTSNRPRKPRAPALELHEPQQALELREQAVLKLQFQAGSLNAAKAALEEVLAANLMRLGVKNLMPTSFIVKYNSYNPRGGGIGFLDVSVSMDWPALKGKGYVRQGDLFAGIPLLRDSMVYNDGRPLYELTTGTRVHVAFPVSSDEGDESKDLVLFKATLLQEKALRSALEALRASQETTSVAQVLQKGSGHDQKTLIEEAELKKVVANLEQELQDKKEELRVAMDKASEVRKRLRDTDTPASKSVREQLNALREQLGMTSV